MMIKKRITNILNFGPCARMRPYKSNSENTFFCKNFSSLLLSNDQTNLAYSNDDLGRIEQDCKFHNLGAEVHVACNSYSVAGPGFFC